MAYTYKDLKNLDINTLRAICDKLDIFWCYEDNEKDLIDLILEHEWS